ncbi:hypothetical protein Bcav_3607 [Beutenbergia cavernae DSM 12333]|uniref:Uncharacterized protein n=1 Tax=Beutenbergia cavernae (strain ATCC BAA-8 / DSM 12333 / CCUG 43141 / JCM 11478 / NBRC 16432 / NCIMB 13614 / HKI 0122) TaxID=471853 RepID=C5C305_BEUC1|nr:hypothetical protein [Beutenbergia cavernae]ACQ81849.1 hypothetical protein Bcav_3607 [Beutenbergia cavernae DSM 12333]
MSATPPGSGHPGSYEPLPAQVGPYEAPADAVVPDRAATARVIGAWVVFVAGALLVLLVAIIALFGVAHASSGCDLADPRARPDFCGSPVVSAAVWLVPLGAIGAFLVGAPIGIVLLRRSAWVVAVPVGLLLLALAALVGALVFVS